MREKYLFLKDVTENRLTVWNGADMALGWMCGFRPCRRDRPHLVGQHDTSNTCTLGFPMNVRSFVVPSSAFLAALAGGLVSHLRTNETASAKPDGTLRATRIELVDQSGKTRAFIGTDSDRETALVFVDDQQRERAAFGLWSYSPRLVMKVATARIGSYVIFLPVSMIGPRYFYVITTALGSILGSLGMTHPSQRTKIGESWQGSEFGGIRTMTR